MTGSAREWQHDELALDLAGYLAGPELMVWTDMQLGPSGSPRPDVFTLRRSYSKPHPMAYECKISRSDLRSDTTSGKWQTYLKYAGAVTFAVPDGLCTPADIPAGCGLIVRKEKLWRYARRPTLQRVQMPFDACMKLLIDGVSRTYKTAEPRPRTVSLWREPEAVRKRFGKAVAEAARDLVAAQNRLETMKQAADQEWQAVQQSLRLRADDLKKRYQAEEAEWARVRNEVLEWLDVDTGSIELKAACSADLRVAEADKKLANTRLALERLLAAMPEIPAHSIAERPPL